MLCFFLLAEGLAILSKFPILETNVILLTRNYATHMNDFNQRICIAAKVLHLHGKEIKRDKK
jgi:hypothetical protein